MTTAIISLISALCGGALIKIIEAFIIPKSKQADIATAIRDELREDISQYRKEVSDLRSEVDYWRVSYFKVIEFMVKDGKNIPDELFLPYKKDPRTPDIKA